MKSPVTATKEEVDSSSSDDEADTFLTLEQLSQLEPSSYAMFTYTPDAFGKQCESYRVSSPTPFFGHSNRDDLDRRYYIPKHTSNSVPMSPGPVYGPVSPTGSLIFESETRNSPKTVFSSVSRPSFQQIAIRERDSALIHRLNTASEGVGGGCAMFSSTSQDEMKGMAFGTSKRVWKEVTPKTLSPGPKYAPLNGTIGTGRGTSFSSTQAEAPPPVLRPRAHHLKASRAREVAARLQGPAFTSIGKQVVSRSKSSASFGFGATTRDSPAFSMRNGRGKAV